jgi:integrase
MRSAAVIQSLGPLDLLQLPATVTTRDGATFDPRLDLWSYREALQNIYIDIQRSIADSAPALVLPAKKALIWYAMNRSPGHFSTMHARLAHFLKFRASLPDVAAEIRSTDIINYKAWLPANQAWYLSSLSGFLKRWHRLGYPGVHEEVVRLLDSLTLSGVKKGAAVASMDPLKGPLTNVEVEAVQDAIHAAYADGTMDERDYLLSILFMALGCRSIQFASLKVCDLRLEATDQGDHAYFLSIPRAKQRGQMSRTLFKERALTPQLGSALYEYANRVRNEYSGLLNDPSQAPLFPQKIVKQCPAGFEYHMTAASLGDALTTALSKLGVISERTGEELNIAPVRFRRTLGTRAAQEGHGELVIAELLDHNDTQNVGVYTASTPEIANRIDRAIAMTMAPLAQAFRGIVIRDESQATRHGDNSSRIVDLRIDQTASPMGSCGQHSFCGFNAPVACYTCSSFEPWLDGPHEAVLNYLIERREQLLATTDQRLASVNDRTIFAVAEVIQLCEALRASEVAAV